MADRRATEAREQLVAAVRQHAVAHYDEGGWDFVVEAWDDAKIVREIGEAFTPAGAIRKVAQVVRIQADVRADIMATAF